MSVAKAAWVGSYFTCFSIKFDATNDKSSKDENSKRPRCKEFKGILGNFPSPGGPSHPCPQVSR